MSLPPHTDVLIVGAGPTGLACAITLAGLGVQFTIVDSSLTNQNGSRAAAIHARTLEVLNSIALAKPLIASGIQSEGVILHGGTNKLLEAPFSQLRDETDFPMVLITPQHELERVFRERLSMEGIKILRNQRVVGMKEGTEGAAGLQVTFEDGAVVSARYVIGADGSRSTIRRLAGIEFKDPDTGIAYDDKAGSSVQLMLGDVYLEEPLEHPIPRDTLSAHLDKFLLLIPLRSDGSSDKGTKPTSYWRLAMGFSPNSPELPRNPSLEYLQQMLDERNPWGTKITISSVVTASRYRVRSALASTFFKKLGEGVVLLVGDAAHVHSPAGGQGVNLGICDAVDLARSVHAHMTISETKQGASEQELDLPLSHYSSSRRKIAIKVIGTTKGLNIIINTTAGWRRSVRNMFFWIMGSLPFARKMAMRRISGLAYRNA